MTVGARRRGEPLLALLAILGSWVGLRAAFWQPLYPSHALSAQPGQESAGQESAGQESAGEGPVHGQGVVPGFVPDVPKTMAVRAPSLLATPLLAPPAMPVPRFSMPSVGGSVGVSRLAAPFHETLIPLPESAVPPARRESPSQNAPRSVASPPVRHWSGDAWLLLRSGSIVAASGAALPAYGASQAGAVLRYRLDPGGDRRLNLYLRATGALVTVPGGAHEEDAAIGVSARVVPSLPVVLAAEERVSRFDDGSTHARPAAMAITEVPPVALPLGWRADLYAAGGYVGGAAATGFADGQLHLDHAVDHLGTARLRLGAGAWGGGQQGVARFDVGPSASLAIPDGRAVLRLRLDWRWRVAGNAAPASGPALTLAAGF